MQMIIFDGGSPPSQLSIIVALPFMLSCLFDYKVFNMKTRAKRKADIKRKMSKK